MQIVIKGPCPLLPDVSRFSTLVKRNPSSPKSTQSIALHHLSQATKMKFNIVALLTLALAAQEVTSCVTEGEECSEAEFNSEVQKCGCNTGYKVNSRSKPDFMKDY